MELTPTSCREIAEVMKEMGRRPEGLVSVVEACERPALELG